jgi:uncharacterized protein
VIGESTKLQVGHVFRHLPRGSNADKGIALLDIAQDFLLAHLAEKAVFPHLVVFKGGTALRKLFAGAQGRFSTDIDLAIADPSMDRAEVAQMVAEAANVTLGPFTFSPVEERGRWQIGVSGPLGNSPVNIKLDVGPPCWLPPEERPFVAIATHQVYGFELPVLPCMAIEEILAEKIARLARLATARDASDLVWAMTTSPFSAFSRERVRRLAMLKVWVDNHGLGNLWSPAQACRGFDPERWLRPGREWDDEQIGLLAHPPPPIEDLERSMIQLYAWLATLDADEARWAAANAADRKHVIQALQRLEASVFASGMVALY